MRNLEVSGHISEKVAREYIAYALEKNPNLEPRTVFGFDVEFVDVAGADTQGASERLARVVSCNKDRTVVAVAIVGQPAASEETIIQIQDFVSSHGFGEATQAGIELALKLMADGDDVATAAAEVVSRGLTADDEE